MKRHRFGPRHVTPLLIALLTAACGGTDGLLAPNHGRVRILIGSDTGFVPLAAPAAADLGGPALHDGPSDDNSGPGDGEHRVFPLIKAANVTFASVLARNLDGVLENVEMDLPVTVDVITLETGRQIQLPDGELPAGTYDQVVVVMTEAHLVLRDGTEITIDPPGGGWTAIVPLCPPVEVEESGTSTVSLTLDVRNAVIWLDGRFHFAPRFKPPLACRGELPPPPPPPAP
jgi:hypothetical protein